ncbi:MAG: hypothetical protein JSV42_19285 [Chloroflexota bacterium]|nr:MAG: hypothetical protein JSV42_19285 [Chloroflexota bacterium]
MWQPQISALRSGYQVILCDLPAHAGDMDIPGEYTVQKLGESVVHRLDELGIQELHVCGHSGMLANSDYAARTRQADDSGRDSF